MGGAAIVGKVIAFLAHVALGWLLFADDFRVYALVLSLTVIVSALRDGGTGRVLLQQGSQFADIASPVFRIALGFNVAAALILGAIAPAAASFYGEPKLTALILIVAVSIPLGTPASIFRCGLAVNTRFKELAGIDAKSGLLRSGSMVLFAYIGFGVWSFVLPSILVPIYEWWAMRRANGPIPRGQLLTRELCRKLLKASRWVMLATPAISLIMRGDYLVVGKQSIELLGSYFFGFQLIGSLSAPVSAAIMLVVMPMLAKVKDDPVRMGASFVRASRYLALAIAPVSFGSALVAAPLTDMLWQGKWNQAVPVVQVMAIALIPMMLGNLSLSVLESVARWRLRTNLLWIHAISVLLAAFYGASTGSLFQLSIWIAAAHGVNGLMQSILATKLVGVNQSVYFRGVAGSVILSAIAFCGVILVVTRILPMETAIQQLLTSAGLFTATICVGYYLFLRRSLTEIRQLSGR